MYESDKLQYYASYDTVDIWKEQNIKSGFAKYVFWYDGKSYECDTYYNALNKIKGLINTKLGRIKE